MAESPKRPASDGEAITPSLPTRGVTLSNENAPSRSQPAPDPCPAANGAPTGRRRPPAGRFPPPLPPDCPTSGCADAR
jgi:hypothetical protein